MTIDKKKVIGNSLIVIGLLAATYGVFSMTKENKSKSNYFTFGGITTTLLGTAILVKNLGNYIFIKPN